MRTLGLFVWMCLLIGGCTPAAKDSGSVTKDKGTAATASNPAATTASTPTTGGTPAGKRLNIEIDVDSLPSFDVDKGKTAQHPIKVVRQDYQGELAMEFDVPADAGLKLEADAIPAGKDSTLLRITAKADAKGGKVSIRVKAPGHQAAVLVEPEIRPR